MSRPWVAWGAVLGGLAVGLGAFAAHGLEGKLSPARLDNFETAARYQMYHALALVAVGLMKRSGSSTILRIAGFGFVTGCFLFSGSLYALALTDVRLWGAVTPFGGVAFLVAWVALAIAAWRLEDEGDGR